MAGYALTFVLGTRPEIIKLSPLIHECQERNISFEVIHTGQHYSPDMDSVFFDKLSLPEPEYHLGVGSGSHGQQTGVQLSGIAEILEQTMPEYVIVQGDTNSSLAGSIAASKLDTQLCHVEAGLRSYDRNMPEEINRILADHASNILFAPTPSARENLRAEAIDDDRILVTGNTIVDALHTHRDKVSQGVLDSFGLTEDEFFLLTVHRPENVDNPVQFSRILEGVNRATGKFDMQCLYPIHPRSSDQLNKNNIEVPSSIQLTEPLDYLDFIKLQDSAALVFTDSGGVQEESCILGTPCVTLRSTTERPETVEVGSNVIIGTNPEDIVKGCDKMLRVDTDWANPFGNGGATEKILGHLENIS